MKRNTGSAKKTARQKKTRTTTKWKAVGAKKRVTKRKKTKTNMTNKMKKKSAKQS